MAVRSSHTPALIECDALRLPFADESFDALLSVCAIEHFDDGGEALDEMSRILKPGGELFMSADVLSRSRDWPKLREAHCAKYHVQHTYTHESLAELLGDRGMELVDHSYQFRSRSTERLYLSLSAYGGRVGIQRRRAAHATRGTRGSTQSERPWQHRVDQGAQERMTSPGSGLIGVGFRSGRDPHHFGT